jgi:capsular polysaccharide biosynthesis protein
MPITYGQLQSMITISNPTQSRILEISITAPSPSDAQVIVNKLCEIGAASIMDTLGIDQVNLVDEGKYNANPANPMVTALTPIATLVAVVVVYGIYVLMYVLDDKIKTPDDVEKYLGLTVLGLIPNIGGESGSKYGKYGKYARYGRYGTKYGKGNAKY